MTAGPARSLRRTVPPAVLAAHLLAYVVLSALGMMEPLDLFIAVAGQKHPQVLHGRTHAGVVQVDDMQLIAGDQYITRVEIAMQTNIA